MSNKIKIPPCHCGTKVYVQDCGDGIHLARYYIMCPACGNGVFADTRKRLYRAWVEANKTQEDTQ